MEFTLSEKKWWQTQLPEEEKEKEWAHNVKRDNKEQGARSTEAMDKDKDYWNIVEETEGEAMRRRMMAASQLHARRHQKRCVYTNAAIVFAAISVLGIVLVIFHSLATPDGKLHNKTENYEPL